MVIDRPYQELNIPVSSALRMDLDARVASSEFAQSPFAVFNFANEQVHELLHTQWVTDFETLGFGIKNVLVTYRAPGFVDPNVHIDMLGSANPQPAIFALNWVPDSQDDGDMIWYNLPTRQGNAYTDSAFGLPNSHATNWCLDQFDGTDLSRFCVRDRLCLIRVDLPHTVIMGVRPRWSISVRLQRPWSAVSNWQAALDLFREWVVVH